MSSAFEEFRSEVSAIEQGAAANLKNYFLELIECAHNTYTGANIDALREQLIAPFFPEALERARTNIHCLLSECEETGLTTSRLYLKTWMSIINTQVNTAAGKGGSSHVEL